MAQCISFEEARKRREMHGRPLKRRIRNRARPISKPHVHGAMPAPTGRSKGAAPRTIVNDARVRLGRLLLALFFPGKKSGGGNAPATGAGPLAS